jgi:methyl-accepting chemotaxis protein
MTDTIINLSATFKYGVEEGIEQAMQAGRILTSIREQLEASLSDPDTLSSREEARDLLEALNEVVEPNAQQTTAIAKYFDELSQAFAQVKEDWDI